MQRHLRGKEGKPFGEQLGGTPAQRALQHLSGVIGGAQKKRENRRRLRTPECAIGTDGQADFQRSAEQWQVKAVDDLQCFSGTPRAPLIKLVGDPSPMVQDQRFDFLDRGTRRGADAQSAVVDGQTDGTSPGAAQHVGNDAVTECDRARRLVGRQRFFKREQERRFVQPATAGAVVSARA